MYNTLQLLLFAVKNTLGWHYACNLSHYKRLTALYKQKIDTRELIMDIKSNSLFAQMQSMSLQATGNKIPAVGGELPSINGASPVNPSTNDFGNLLTDALKTVNELQQDAGDKKVAFEMGDRSVTLAEVMVASSKSGIALDATIQVRNKFVEAYKEIMSMPV